MGYEDNWEKGQKLGEGGQGEVFLATEKKHFDVSRIKRELAFSVQQMSRGQDEVFDQFRNAIAAISSFQADTSHLGALKILHNRKDARHPGMAMDRIGREIEAMSLVDHPNILRIRERDSEGRWFVSQYHPKKTLHDDPTKYRGDLLSALKAFRGLVTGAAELHAHQMIHRDIKPQNIFVSVEDRLVLGDFGIVFFSDQQHTRISETFENVGSRDWMPGWAMTLRIEDVRPSFDVFALGKVLWSMLSGKPVMPLWYYNEATFDLCKLFPNNAQMLLANELLSKCVVQHERDCLDNANELLHEVDKLLIILQNNGDYLSDDVRRFCRVCGLGHYKRKPQYDELQAQLYLTLKNDGRGLKTFVCDQCGHIQWFAISEGKGEPGWRNIATASLGLEVISASYWADDSHKLDRTEKVKSQLRDGELCFRVTNELLGPDPKQDTPKKLFLSCLIDGVPKHLTYDEGDTVTLPLRG